jgi:hypothetical protein
MTWSEVNMLGYFEQGGLLQACVRALFVRSVQAISTSRTTSTSLGSSKAVYRANATHLEEGH